MRKVLVVLCFIAVILAIALAGPQTPAQDPPAEPEAPDTEAPDTEAPDTEPLETFEPTEKLSADSAVSFPVDI